MRLILTTLAFGLFATAVQAGGPPITMQVGEDVPTTSFQIIGPADFQDLKINATANTDYFVGMASLFGERAQIFDPNGRPLAAFDSSEGSQGPEDWGAELHALAAGTYTV